MSNVRSSQVLEARNSIQTSVLNDLCIHQMFELQVERSPDAVAVVFENQQLTYRQLNHQANKIAHHLRALGVGPEVLVGICMERSLEMVLGVLAILKAGGAYVPLDPAYPLERLAFILDDTQTPLLLTQEKLVKSLPEHKAQVVCLDSDWKLIAHNSEENPICETTADNLIYVIYTSGSTGQPKGVMISHRGICNQLYWRQTAFGLTATDRVLQTISFSFDPSVWQIFWPLCFGAQLILPCPGGHQDSAYLVKTIAQQQITVIALVPSMLRVLLEEKEIENCNLRHISCGGEALPVELIDHFFARFQVDNVLHNVYGPTEASIDATFWTCKRLCDRPIAPIGCPIANTQIYILDSDLQPLPSGEPGELYISGIGLARGYLNRPDLTDEKFIPNPFGSKGDRLYKTGDLARYLPDGNIEFLGRIDRQVKIRGFRIEVEEIEAVLSQHPNVQTAVVVASDDANGNKRLVAYVVPNQEQQVIVSELRSFLKQKLANYMVPSAFVMLDALPLTPNGKVDRHALPAPNQTRPDAESDFVAPRDSVELQLTQIWSEVLGIQPIGVTDNFFDLGGYSLIAIRLLTHIEQKFGKTLPLSTFLQAPTVEQLASILHQEESSALWESLVPIQTAGEKLPLFCVHGGDGNVIVFYNLSRHLGSDQPVYALQPQGLDGKQPPQTTIEDMALNYIGHIRTVQPEGPYLLGGFSSGGVVAFEMARQLQAQGQEVALLALFDARAPRSPLYFESKKRSLRERVSLHLGNLSKLTPQEQLGYLMAGMKSRFGKMINKFYQQIRSPQQSLIRADHSLSMVVPTADETILPTSSEVIDHKRSAIEATIVKAQKQAVTDYLPQAYSGRVVLFRSAQQPWWVISDRLLGWRELVSGELEDYEVPGYHETLVRANVGELAEKLQVCLSQLSE